MGAMLRLGFLKTPLDKPDMGRVNTRPLRQHFLRNAFSMPVSLQHPGERFRHLCGALACSVELETGRCWNSSGEEVPY